MIATNLNQAVIPRRLRKLHAGMPPDKQKAMSTQALNRPTEAYADLTQIERIQLVGDVARARRHHRTWEAHHLARELRVSGRPGAKDAYRTRCAEADEMMQKEINDGLYKYQAAASARIYGHEKRLFEAPRARVDEFKIQLTGRTGDPDELAAWLKDAERFVGPQDPAYAVALKEALAAHNQAKPANFAKPDRGLKAGGLNDLAAMGKARREDRKHAEAQRLLSEQLAASEPAEVKDARAVLAAVDDVVNGRDTAFEGEYPTHF